MKKIILLIIVSFILFAMGNAYAYHFHRTFGLTGNKKRTKFSFTTSTGRLEVQVIVDKSGLVLMRYLRLKKQDKLGKNTFRDIVKKKARFLLII
ncbi:MAG: hypothetical protein ACYCTB_10765 [bacterium]